MNTLNRFILTFIILTCAALGRAASAPVFEWSVYKQADYPANGMTIIITAEGYTASQKAQFISDAQTTIDGMLEVEPWKSYASHINFYTSWVVSNQAGITIVNGSTPVTTVDTAFKSVYNEAVREEGGWDAGIMAAYQKAVPVKGHHLLLVNAPAVDFGKAYLNSGTPGAATEAICTNTDLTHPQYGVAHIALHELGHSVGGLDDEYNANHPGVDYPNYAYDLNHLPWAKWIDASTPLPTPDSFVVTTPGVARPEWYSVAGAFTQANHPGYSATYDSIMLGGGQNYGCVGTEAMLLAFYRNTGLLLAQSPSADSAIIRGGKEQTFTVTTWVAPATIATTWYLDGSQYTASQSVTLQANSLTPGAHTLKVVVKDTTAMVRNDPHNYTQAEHSWALTIGNVPLITTQPNNVSVTAGQSASFSVAVDASGATVSYAWKKNGVTITGATAATYSISSTSSTDAGSYTVVATTADGTVTSNAATLSVTTPPVTPSSSGSGGGGGAISPWAIFGLALLSVSRLARRTHRKFNR